MYHHDHRDYNTAASAAAKAGRQKIEALFDRGRVSAAALIEDVQSKVLKDAVVKAKAVKFGHGEDGFSLAAGDMQGVLHDHALGQVLSDAGMDRKFANGLLARGEWGAGLVTTNLNEIMGHSDGRHLVRTVTRDKPQVMGWLSDKYKRIDSRPLLDAFIGAVQNFGMVPYEGYALDTKVRLRTLLPHVFEPVPNEVMAFGLEWGNSDYGDGGHRVSLFVLRIWCTNLALADQCLRQVHLGRRLDDNILYSQETYRLDTQANVSALKDVVANAVAPDRVNGLLKVVEEAGETEVKGRDGVMGVLKKHLDKGLAERAAELFDGPDVQNLPPGNTVYRLSNAVSWLAQDKSISTERRLELQDVAGKLMGVQGLSKAREV